MSWAVIVNALHGLSSPMVSWPHERCRVVRMVGFCGQPRWSGHPPARRRPTGSPRRPRVVLTDEELLQALKSGRATGPTSLASLFGIAASSGHRRLASLVRAGRLERESWNCWRVVR